MSVEYVQIVSVPVSLESTVAELAGRGVTFTQEIQEAPWARYVSFQDPDGNSWVIQELRGS